MDKKDKKVATEKYKEIEKAIRNCYVAWVDPGGFHFADMCKYNSKSDY